MVAPGDALAGARRMAPLLLSIVPFSFLVGVTAIDAGLSPIQTIAMSLVVFAGAAQIAAVDLLGRDAPVTVVALTAIVINVRFVMYSASLAPYVDDFPSRVKYLVAYLLTDQAYAVSLAEFRAGGSGRERRAFYFGAALAFWLTWQAGTAVGVLAGRAIPAGLSLDFAVPLTFLALLFPALTDRHLMIAAVVAGGVAVAGAVLPFDFGLVTAALFGIAAGVALDVRAGEFPRTERTTDATESADRPTDVDRSTDADRSTDSGESSDPTQSSGSASSDRSAARDGGDSM